MQTHSTVILFLIWLGIRTLAAASIAAIAEVDRKKLVALSTLRQLGLIFISMSLGNMIICLFHVLAHAVAKANLFIVVGTFLHFKYREQDSRSLGHANISVLLLFRGIVSVLSLRGFRFLSGFFSKDFILLGVYVKINNFLVFRLLLLISSITLSYCLSLITGISHNNNII
jgi:NADH:ubiquinone oxidoreductase subunit 5 (subunit L)/multisubunit Na+/H+ antiporter MnhA subunit